jgi:hypothetical protein
MATAKDAKRGVFLTHLDTKSVVRCFQPLGLKTPGMSDRNRRLRFWKSKKLAGSRRLITLFVLIKLSDWRAWEVFERSNSPRTISALAGWLRSHK